MPLAIESLQNYIQLQNVINYTNLQLFHFITQCKYFFFEFSYRNLAYKRHFYIF